jgi:hypothetical protein
MVETGEEDGMRSKTPYDAKGVRGKELLSSFL